MNASSGFSMTTGCDGAFTSTVGCATAACPAMLSGALVGCAMAAGAAVGAGATDVDGAVVVVSDAVSSSAPPHASTVAIADRITRTSIVRIADFVIDISPLPVLRSTPQDAVFVA